jgi:hypothetical protein
VIPDARAAADDMHRVVDESGEDYLFPARCFLPTEPAPRMRPVFVAA